MSLSERRACLIVSADRKMIRYALRGRLRELANERRRFDYRRLFVLLRREGSGQHLVQHLHLDPAVVVASPTNNLAAAPARACLCGHRHEVPVPKYIAIHC